MPICIMDPRSTNSYMDLQRQSAASWSPIICLPSEVRIPIWSYLEPAELKTIRSVCKCFKAEIDTSIGLPIDLDERLFTERNVGSTLPPTAYSLRIWGSERTFDYISRLLYNSRLVKEVIFSGPTDVSDFKKILTRCPNLASLTITQRCQFFGKIHIQYKLRTVTSFSLGLEDGPITRRDEGVGVVHSPMSWNVYTDFLTNLHFPCLKFLKISYTVPPKEDYATIFTAIMKYLFSHKTVTELFLSLKRSKDIVAADTSDELEVVAVAHPSQQPLHFSQPQLQSLAFKRLTVWTELEARRTWETVLAHQKNLELLDFLNHEGTDWSFFQRIIKNNRKTLRVLRLRKLLPEVPIARPQHRVDVGAFELESCPNLVELVLSRFEDSVCPPPPSFMERASSQFPELIRLKTLPISLKDLKIQGFTVKTDDLKTIPDRLKNLKRLELQFLGYNNQGQEDHGKGSSGAVGESSRFHGGDGGGDAPPPTDKAIGNKKDISTLWREEAFYKCTGVIGTTSSTLHDIMTNLRSLEALFVEEFLNEHTSLRKDPKSAGNTDEIPIGDVGGCNTASPLGYLGTVRRGGKELISHDGDSGRECPVWDCRLDIYSNQYQQLKILRKGKKLEQI